MGPGQQNLKLLLGDYATSFISLRASGGQQGVAGISEKSTEIYLAGSVDTLRSYKARGILGGFL